MSLYLCKPKKIVMSRLKIALPDGNKLSVEFNHNLESHEIAFENDIHVNNWTIHRIILIGGPCSSRYKYDCDQYLEFVILDKNGEQQIKRYYFNIGYNNDVGLCGLRKSAIESIVYFVENCPIFKCEDWADSNAFIALLRIKNILNESNSSNYEKIDKINSLFKGSNTVCY